MAVEDGWTMKGGSELGTNRTKPDEDLGLCAFNLQKFDVQGLFVIGGFEAYTALLKLEKARAAHPRSAYP